MYGNVDLLILNIIGSIGPCHGLGITDAIVERSEGVMSIEVGALYRALHRLERDGFLRGEWRKSDRNRKARFYTLTTAGQKELERAETEWTNHVETVRKVLGIGWETAR
jgi:transcriptional regulator